MNVDLEEQAMVSTAFFSIFMPLAPTAMLLFGGSGDGPKASAYQTLFSVRTSVRKSVL